MERKKVWCRYRGTAASPECLGATTRQGEQTLHATLPWAACRQCLETMGPGKMIMQTHKGTGAARPGLSLPNTDEACATGGTSTTVPCKASMSRCKQEQLSEDDDTDQVLISSPLTARYRHMATRAVVVVWTARDEIQPSFSISHRPATTDERKNNRTFLGRHRPIALSWDHGIERPLPTATSPGSTGRGRRRARWPSRPDDFAMCVPALDSQHRQGRVVAGRPPRWVAFYPPSFLAFGLRRRRIGRCRYGPRQIESAAAGSQRVFISRTQSSRHDLAVDRRHPSCLPGSPHRGHHQQFARTLAWQSLKAR